MNGVEYGFDDFYFNSVFKDRKKDLDTRVFAKNGVMRIKVGDIRADLMYMYYYNSMSIITDDAKDFALNCFKDQVMLATVKKNRVTRKGRNFFKFERCRQGS